jgi:hypothetical protein
MIKQSKSVRVINQFFRQLRINGLGLVCFNRLGHKELDSYQKHLQGIFCEMPEVKDEEAENLAEIVTKFAQSTDSDLGNVSRTIDRAFEDNSRVVELKILVEEQAKKIEELENELEIDRVQRNPIRSIFQVLAANLKSGELAKKS